MRFPLRIVFAGTPAAAVPSLQTLIAGGAHEIVAVITRPDARVGRGRTLQPSPIAELAEQAGLPVIRAASARTPEFLDALTALRPDAAAVVAYGALLPQPVLDVPTHGWINLHFSLLPAWRGASPVAAAIRHGDQITGASTFRLEAGLDTGPVFGTITETIGFRDTTGELLERLSRSGADLLRVTLDGIATGTVKAVPQPSDGVSHFGKVSVDDARIDWNRTAVEIDRLVRSVTPEPGAWTESRWGKLGLGPVEPMDAALPPGALVAGKRDVLVGTATGAVRLSTVTAPGKKSVQAADWARGSRPDAAERLGVRPDTDAAPADPSTEESR